MEPTLRRAKWKPAPMQMALCKSAVAMAAWKCGVAEPQWLAGVIRSFPVGRVGKTALESRWAPPAIWQPSAANRTSLGRGMMHLIIDPPWNNQAWCRSMIDPVSTLWLMGSRIDSWNVGGVTRTVMDSSKRRESRQPVTTPVNTETWKPWQFLLDWGGWTSLWPDGGAPRKSARRRSRSRSRSRRSRRRRRRRRRSNGRTVGGGWKRPKKMLREKKGRRAMMRMPGRRKWWMRRRKKKKKRRRRRRRGRRRTGS